MDRDLERKAGKAMSLGASVFAVVFALFWCAVVYSMGVWFMLIPGLIFVGVSVYRLVVVLKLLRRDKKPDRPEPWEPQAPREIPDVPPRQSAANGFCPYCGEAVSEQFRYCPRCGRQL